MNNAKLFSDEAANIYERAISTLLRKNMLLYFSFADYEEVKPSAPITPLTPEIILGFLNVITNTDPVVCVPQSRMKHEKVHSIYNRLLAIEDIDPTLVSFMPTSVSLYVVSCDVSYH